MLQKIRLQPCFVATVYSCGFITFGFLLRSYVYEAEPNARVHSSSPPERGHNIDPDVASVEDILLNMKWSNSTSCLLSQTFGGMIVHYEDVHIIDGRKAVCLDKGVAPVPESCVVYSFGIRDDWSFDDTMASFGCHVFSFDPFIRQKDHKRSEQVYFYNMGLSGQDRVLPNGKKFKTLDSIYRMLQGKLPHRVIDHVKIDIEDSEWDVIPNIVSSGILDRVKQIGVEVHLLKVTSQDEFRRRYRIVKSIEDAGFVRFASEMNPLGKGIVRSRSSKTAVLAYELAWYNPKFYQTDDTV